MAGPDRPVWSPQAHADLADIWRYYANAAGTAVADKIAREIVDSSKALERFPHAGRARDDVRPQLRSVVANPFVIFYRLAENTMQIVRVLDGRRDIERYSPRTQENECQGDAARMSRSRMSHIVHFPTRKLYSVKVAALQWKHPERPRIIAKGGSFARSGTRWSGPGCAENLQWTKRQRFGNSTMHFARL